jgi:hypothetical protein
MIPAPGIGAGARILIAPGYGRVRISTIPSGDWLDISDYVTQATVHRGTNHELQIPDAGECTLTLKNYDGRLTPNRGGWSNSNSILPYGSIDVPLTYQVFAGSSYGWVPIFTGYIGEWGPKEWSQAGFMDFTCVAYDQLKAATDAYMDPNYLGTQYRLNGALFWYPCDDNSMTSISNKSVQNFAAYDASGNARDGSFAFIQDNYLTSSTETTPRPELNLEADTLTCNSISKTTMASSAWTFNALVLLDNSSALPLVNPLLIASTTNGTSGWALDAVFLSQKWYPRFAAYNAAGARVQTITSSVPFDVNVTQMLTLVRDGSTMTLYLNGTVVGTCSTSGMVIPASNLVVMGHTGPGKGMVYSPWYGGVGDIALFDHAVSASVIGGNPTADISTSSTPVDVRTGWWGFVYPESRRTGEWVNLQLINLGAPALDRYIMPGQSVLIEPDAANARSRSVRADLEQTTLDELGQLFVDGSGKINFLDRSWAASTPGTWLTLGTTTTGPTVGPGVVPVVKATISNTDQDLWTAAEGSRGASNPVIVDSPSPQASIPGRTGGFGQKTFHWPGTLNYLTDVEVRNVLLTFVNRYDVERTRVDTVTFKPWAYLSQFASTSADYANALHAIATLEIWRNVYINLPAHVDFGGNLSTFALIEGIEHSFDFTVGEWTITLSTVPAWNAALFFVPGAKVPSWDGADIHVQEDGHAETVVSGQVQLAADQFPPIGIYPLAP